MRQLHISNCIVAPGIPADHLNALRSTHSEAHIPVSFKAFRHKRPYDPLHRLQCNSAQTSRTWRQHDCCPASIQVVPAIATQLGVCPCTIVLSQAAYNDPKTCNQLGGDVRLALGIAKFWSPGKS